MKAGHVYVIKTILARPPKEKIVFCICSVENLFFWFNSEARKHGIGQLLVLAQDHPALSHNCYLDCSRVTTFPPNELRAALHRGPISPALASKIGDFLINSPPKTLTPKHWKLAIATLSTFNL